MMKTRNRIELFLAAILVGLLLHLDVLPAITRGLLPDPGLVAKAGISLLALALLGGGRHKPLETVAVAEWEPVAEPSPPAIFSPEDPVSCAMAAASLDGSWPPTIEWSG